MDVFHKCMVLHPLFYLGYTCHVTGVGPYNTYSSLEYANGLLLVHNCLLVNVHIVIFFHK